MVATFEKLVKTDGKAPDDLEKQVATAITELSQTNGEIKNQLSELYFVGAQVCYLNFSFSDDSKF